MEYLPWVPPCVSKRVGNCGIDFGTAFGAESGAETHLKPQRSALVQKRSFVVRLKLTAVKELFDLLRGEAAPKQLVDIIGGIAKHR